eukprot:gene27697-31289_t
MALAHAGDGGHHLARRAVAALQRVVVDEGLLHRMQRAVGRGDALDGGDGAAVGLHAQREAGGDAPAVEVHGAGTALAVVAALLGAGQVLLDGRRINSCLTLAVMHEGAQITTIEGLGNPDQLHPMQAAFVRHDGYQCGYCTPGQICSAVAVLDEISQGKPSHVTADLTARPLLSVEEIRERMSGNICRCGAYSNIVDAIVEVGGGAAGRASPAEAAAAAQRAPGSRFIAGGTNLLDLMKLEIETPAHLIDVNGLALDQIESLPDGGLRVGALVRNTDLASDERVRRDYGVLARALLAGASMQLRNRATTAGNLLELDTLVDVGQSTV